MIFSNWEIMSCLEMWVITCGKQQCVSQKRKNCVQIQFLWIQWTQNRKHVAFSVLNGDVLSLRETVFSRTFSHRFKVLKLPFPGV